MNTLNKIILTISLLLLAATAFSQQERNAAMKNHLLERSTTQKVVGYSLLGTGVVTALIGAAVQQKANKEQYGFHFDFTGAWISIAGGAAGVAGVAFLLSSAKNKKKAATFSFSTRTIVFPLPGGTGSMTQPIINVKIR